MKNGTLLALLLALPLPGPAWAEDIHSLLGDYLEKARQANPSLKEFSAEKGKQFYVAEKTKPDGTRVSCATCHTPDPTRPGLSRANKEIAPMAPSVNPERFKDLAHVEKWFRRNCNDVLSRACTDEEKGHFLAYLASTGKK